MNFGPIFIFFGAAMRGVVCRGLADQPVAGAAQAESRQTLDL